VRPASPTPSAATVSADHRAPVPEPGAATPGAAEPAGQFAATPPPANAATSATSNPQVAGGGRAGAEPSQLPGVASQLVSVLAPLRSSATGTQTLTIALHPADLGSVQATLVLANGTLTVRLVASTPAGAAALHASLPDLQHGLEDGGQRSSVLLGDPGSGNASFGNASSGNTQQGFGEARQQAGLPEVDAPSQVAPVRLDRSVAGSSLHVPHLLDVRA
jgi:flagellar hook-length control protein FliK